MPEDYFEPPLEETEFVLLDICDVKTAHAVVIGCEECCPDSEIPFDWILDQVTSRDPKVTEYLMPTAVCCPSCDSEIHEKTLVQWNGAHWMLVRTTADEVPSPESKEPDATPIPTRQIPE
jgi:hypothetical protein